MEIIAFENAVIKINEISSIDLFLQEGVGKIYVHSKDGNFSITFPGSPYDAKKKYMEIESMVSQDKSKEGSPKLKDYGDSLIEKVSDEEMNEFGLNNVKTDFPKFYYDSNAYWGWIKSIQDLKKALNYLLEWPNSIDSVHDFLDMSQECEGSEVSPNFGTRFEHEGERTLRDYLKENGVLEAFLLEVEKSN